LNAKAVTRNKKRKAHGSQCTEKKLDRINRIIMTMKKNIQQILLILSKGFFVLSCFRDEGCVLLLPRTTDH